MISVSLQIILAILVGLFALHALIEFKAARKKISPHKKTVDRLEGLFPRVSVLLPVYNEKKVIAKLLHAVCGLEYPADSLEILLLDDSTDDTGQIADEIILKEKARGINIRRLRHERPCGFKAGNLAFGLQHSSGEYIAIFDADCLPPRDFLIRVMPCFNDASVGFLQTGIAFHNANASFLTRFQAAEAAHKEDVTTGFDESGHMASLTGSSCIWRRKCLDDIGGISSITITEDVDMGYTAQLRKWRYRFTQDVNSLAELPETMAGFRVQRQRWARGLVHNAALHFTDLLRCEMPFTSRVHASALMFSPLLLALFYALLLLAPFIALSVSSTGPFFNIICVIFLIAAILWGWSNTSSSGEKHAPAGHIFFTLGYILLFFPLSLYYFSAIIQVAIKGKGNFHSTPKGCGRKKVRHPPINSVLFGLEIASLIWCLGTIICSLETGNYWTLLYGCLAGGGFGMALAFSVDDILMDASSPSHILITGASGSIGSALAREYAAPGIKLTLQGRNEENLRALAQDCEKKGADVTIAIVNLLDTEKTHAWAKELAEGNLPDLFIANAGLNSNTGQQWEGEPWQESVDLVKVNLLANMAIVDALLPSMRKRKSGQIAIVSSLASWYGLPATPSYCATKAALRIWGQSLRTWLAPEGIRVNVILPGYVDSPMCSAMPGPKPFLWQPNRAAKKIRRGLTRNKARISFPFPLNLGIWLLTLLPDRLSRSIAKILGYGR